jgi:ABC-type lipoprotein export system ATPase subunit
VIVTSNSNNSPVNGYCIEVSDLWRTYRTGAHREIQALRGVNLKIEPIRFVAVKGRSGSGKTTLLNCIGGLDHPTSGSVRVFGMDLSTLNNKELTQFYRKHVGFIFQDFGLWPIYSAYENVDIVLRVANASRRERQKRAEYCLELVGLKKWSNHRTNELSGGQQQRVAIARALANQPQLVLADEPTARLDTSTAREIFALFKRIVKDEQVTVLVASHDPLVDEYVDEIVRLIDGQVQL